jgi:hypothetical protein
LFRWALQKLEQQLAAAQAATEAASQQAAAATELADAQLKEKAAADKEWGRRLSAKEKEAASKLREAEARLRELEDKGKLLSGAVSRHFNTICGHCSTHHTAAAVSRVEGYSKAHTRTAAT